MGVEQYYMQSRDERWNIADVTSNGACFGLSLFWIRNKALRGIQDLTFWRWLGIRPNATDHTTQGFVGVEAMNFLNENNDVVRIMQQQKNANALANQQGQFVEPLLTPVIKAFMEYQCPAQLIGAEVTRQAPPRARLLQDLTMNYPGQAGILHVTLAALAYGNNQGHAIACAYVAGGPIHLFDPNGGEVSWSNQPSLAEFEATGSYAHRLLDIYPNVNRATFWTFRV